MAFDRLSVGRQAPSRLATEGPDLIGTNWYVIFWTNSIRVVHTEEVRNSLHAHAFNLFKTFLAGMSIGIFVTLWLEGSLNVFKKATKTDPAIAGGKAGY
jgi:hypothetical protein